MMLTSSLAYSQNAPITFETGAPGNAWTWTTFENGANAALQIVANPSASGANTSATVAKMTTLTTGQPWAGVESLHGAGIGTFTLSSSNAIVKIMVYKSVISDVGIKFATSTGGSTGEIKVPNTLINQWEELTFNFSSKIGETNDQIVVFPDFQTGRTTDNICYFDNITFSAASVSTDPTVAAPTPTRAAGDVKSMFSNAYTNVGVDTWRTSWSNATLTDVQIAGNDTKKYSSLDFVGIETTGANLINADSMGYFHIDVWTPNATSFGVKLVDFGADAAFGGGDDKEHQINVTPVQNSWNSFNFPMSDFVNMTTRGHIAQMILVGVPAGSSTVFIDNVYFAKPLPVLTPTVAAPTPTRAAGDVKSMFSNAYTNVGVDTWRTSWSNATLTDIQIVGNDTKLYSALDFVGIETTGANLINADSMSTFHIDMWTPNATSFGVKLVDFGADAAFGGGDDKEHQINVTPVQNAWNSYDFLLSDFTGLTTKGHIAQMILVGVPSGSSTVYIDNVYFAKPAVVATPAFPAPAPTAAQLDVISMYSNAYTNVGVDTWRTSWSNATLTDIVIIGNETKLYSALDFVGIETTGPNMINASLMSKFHIDMWTPNATSFGVKLVDFGADGTFGGGDDTEHQINVTPTQNSWNSYDFLLSDFTGLTNKGHIAQLILVGVPSGTSTVYIDNVYFSKDAVLLEPTTAAPTPTKAAGNVISLFSNAYTNVAIDTWRTSWSSAVLTEMQVAGDDVKKYSTLDFVGVEATGANLINATTMTDVNIDVWTPNMTAFRLKLVDFGADGAFAGGDDSEHELVFTPTLNGWNTISVPFTDFTGLTAKSHIAQIIFSGLPTGTGTVYIDNFYFSKPGNVGINQNTKNTLKVYPNPSSNVIYVDGIDFNTTTVATIVDLQGKLIKSIELNGTNAIDISELNKGVYIVKVENKVSRIVKM